MMTPFVLRRKKVQVLKDLPPKSEAIEYCDMTDLQRDCYNEALQRSRNALTTADEGELEDLEGDDDDDVEVIAGEEEVKPKRGRKKAVASTKLGTKANASSSAHILTDLRKVSRLATLVQERPRLTPAACAGLEPSDAVPSPVRRQDPPRHVQGLPPRGRVHGPE